MEAKSIEDQLWLAQILASHEPFQHTQIEEHAVALLSFIWKEDILCDPLARFMFQLAESKMRLCGLRKSQRLALLQTDKDYDDPVAHDGCEIGAAWGQ